MTSKIVIDGKEYAFRASGATPLKYRALTGRDLITDIQSLSADRVDTTILSSLAFVMYKQANPEDDIGLEDFLDQFSFYGLIEAYPKMMELWSGNTATTVKAKKK